MPVGFLEQLVGVVHRVGVVEKIEQPVTPELRVPVRRLTLGRQRLGEPFPDHVVHDLPRCVVGAGRLAGRLPGFRVVGGEQILEHPTEELRVERDLPVKGSVLLDRELVVVQEREESLVVEEQRVGNVQLAPRPLPGLRRSRPVVRVRVTEHVDPSPALRGGGEVVQTVEQAAVDEGDRPQSLDEAVRVGQKIAIAILVEVAVRGVGPLAEGALADLGVESGEEQVLEHRAVVVRRFPLVIPERFASEALIEQLAHDEPLLLQEPDEEQAGDQADDVTFGRALAGAVVGEAGFGDGALEPSEQLAVEPPVERLNVEHPLPCGVQVIEGADTHADEARERQLAKNLDMRPVRVAGANVLDERDALQNVPAAVAPVGASVDGGQREGRAVTKQDDDRHGKAVVYDAHHLRQFGPAVAAVIQTRRHEQKGLGAPLVEVLEQARMVADLLPGDLEHDIGGTPRVEQRALPDGQGVLFFEQGEQPGDASYVHCALAVVPERAEQRAGAGAKQHVRGKGAKGLDNISVERVSHRPGWRRRPSAPPS